MAATREVKIPFWSHANGMKDIICILRLARQICSYTVTPKPVTTKNVDGKYEAQVFYVDAQGQNNQIYEKGLIDYRGDKTGQCCRSWSDH